MRLNNKKIDRFISPLRYPGGKIKLVKTLENFFVINNLKNITLVEPYAGGAGASLSLLVTGKADKIIINDLDGAIYSFWKSAVFDTDRFINKIKKTNIDIKEWYKQKKIYTDKNSSIFDLGFATFFLNRTNKSGIIGAGPIGGKKQNSSWNIDARFNKQALIRRILKLGKYRKFIEIFNLDGIKLLRKLAKDERSNRYFIFLDPPYFRKGPTLYLNHYKKEDHKSLRDFLKKSSFKKWIMTYDNDYYIRELYKDYEQKKFSLLHSVHQPKITKELMIIPKGLRFNA